MARTGRFGRLPRAVPSLTATIVAIAREQEATRDQNIMEAWRKGGMFEGQKVTDALILKHWRSRLKDIDKDDPLHDTYSNAVLQYEYAIAESKMTAKYAMMVEPTAKDDKAMADFYLNWAKKVPTDSEFYRVLQRDAGQFLRAAHAKKKAAAQKVVKDNYYERMMAMERKNELPGQVVMQVLTAIGQQGVGGRGAVLGETLLGAPRDILGQTNISQLSFDGIENIMALIDKVGTMGQGLIVSGQDTGDIARRTGEVALNPNDVLYHDASGAPVTRGGLDAMLGSLTPDWTGEFDLAFVQAAIKQQKDGIRQRIDLARSTGHQSDADNLATALAKVNELGNQVQAWPVLEEYDDLQADLRAVMSDSSLMPPAQQRAIDSILAKIGKLADDPRIAADGHLQSQLRGEAEGIEGTVTVAEDMLGATTGFTPEMADPSKSSVALTNYARQELANTIALTSDPTTGYTLTQGNYGPDTNGDGFRDFVPAAGGAEIGPATWASIKNAPSAGPVQSIYMPNGDGGGSSTVAVLPSAVYVSGVNALGDPLPASNNLPVTTFLSVNINGVAVKMYSITDAATGATRWTTDPPWNQDLIKADERGGAIVLNADAVTKTMPLPASPEAIAAGTYAAAESGAYLDVGGGFVLQGFTKDEAGNITNYGQLTYDPTRLVYGTSPERIVAGFDVNTDSYSPTLTAIKALPDGANLLKQYVKDENFLKVLDADARRASGATYDATTGAWTGGDNNLYQRFRNNNLAVMETGMTGNRDIGSRDLWFKEGTATEPVGLERTPAPAVGRGQLAEMADMMPAAALGMAADNRFGALTQAFASSANLRVGDLTSAALTQTPSIKPAGISIVAPSIAPGMRGEQAGIAPAPGPAPYVAPTPTAPTPTPVVTPQLPVYGGFIPPEAPRGGGGGGGVPIKV